MVKEFLDAGFWILVEVRDLTVMLDKIFGIRVASFYIRGLRDFIC